MSSAVNQKFLLGHGGRDTLIHNEGQRYDTISLREIAELVKTPQAKDKADADFVIGSTYIEHDARSHNRQREAGTYWLLCIDVDKGSPSLTELKSAITDLTGNSAALFYSSAGASHEEQKWRVIIPLAEPVSGADYAAVQASLFDLMWAEHSIECDAALARTGQPVFLPNVPPARRDDAGQPLFYHGLPHRGEQYFNVQESRVWQNMLFRKQREQMAEEQAARERAQRAAERAQRAAARPDYVDPVGAFNARYSVSDALLRYGYEQQGASDHYRSPYQTSGSFATRDYGTHWVSLSGSDMAAGIGQQREAYCWGDAFDLYCHFEHGGDMRKAVRAYVDEIRPSPFEQVNRQIEEQSSVDDYSDFDDLPTEEEPDLAPLVNLAEPAEQTWPTPVAPIDEASLPRRAWIYAHHHIRSFLTITASAGGIGKSSLLMIEALAVATGRALLDEPVKEKTKVWLLNLEDPRIEMELRLAAAMRHYEVHHADIAGRLFMDGEDDISLVLAAEGRDGVQQNDALLNYMRDKIIELGIGLVIIDPFISVHQVNENSNMSIQVVVAMLRRLARETNAAVHLVHHVRKGNGADSDIDSVRGAGSLIGAARAARVINRVSADEAAKLGIPEIEARGLFSVTDGKANLAPPPDAQVYRRMIGVKLDNDEWVGVAAGYKLPDQWAGMTDRVVNQILDKIDAGPENGEKWSLRTQDKDRWVGRVIMQQKFGDPLNAKTDLQAKSIIKKWVEEGLLEEVTYRSESQRKDRKGVVSTGRVGEQS